MSKPFNKLKNFFKHHEHDKDKHCKHCGHKKSKCKCDHTDQNGAEPDGGPPQSSEVMEEMKEKENSQEKGANFNTSVKSVDGLSSIMGSRHNQDDKRPNKFEKDFAETKIVVLKTPKSEKKSFEKDVTWNDEQNSSVPDAPRVSFKDPEIFQCKVCGEKHTERTAECNQCKNKMKENTLNQSLKGRYSTKEWRRRETQKRKNTILKRTRLKGGGQSIKVKEQRDEDVKEAKKWLKSIEKSCEKKQSPYFDYSFPVEETGSRSNEKWLALKDVKVPNDDGTEWVLYGERTSAADVCQGEMLEDCWFSAAMACVGERRDLLEKIIISEKINKNGVYALRLCKDGAWKKVLIDDRFPCDDKSRLLYNEVSGNHKVLWPMLVQKAAAKLVGGYQRLNKGLIVEALAMLTGEPCDHMRLQKGKSKSDEEILPDEETVWTRLLLSKKNSHLVGVATIPRDLPNDTFKKTGLVAEHAFAVQDVKQEGEFRLIKLTNPWAKSSVTGCLENSILKDTEVDISVDSEKEIWITLEELMKYFISISFCEVHQDDTLFEIRMKGTFPPSFRDKWKYYTFTVPNHDTDMHFGLFQKNLRDRGATAKENFNDMFFVVLRNSSDTKPLEKEPLFREVVCCSERKARSLVTCKATLNPGGYTVACFAYRQLDTSKGQLSEDDIVDLNKDFTLVIHSSSVIYGDEVDHGTFALLRHAPADALVLTAKQLCMEAKESGNEELKRNRKMDKPKDDLDVFTYTLNWWGQIHVIENKSDKNIKYIRDYSKSELLMNSRGHMLTEDKVPPRQCQVVNVMTALMPDTDWNVIPMKDLHIAPENSKEPHKPEITDHFIGLHGLRPILHVQQT